MGVRVAGGRRRARGRPNGRRQTARAWASEWQAADGARMGARVAGRRAADAVRAASSKRRAALLVDHLRQQLEAAVAEFAANLERREGRQRCAGCAPQRIGQSGNAAVADRVGREVEPRQRRKRHGARRARDRGGGERRPARDAAGEGSDSCIANLAAAEQERAERRHRAALRRECECLEPAVAQPVGAQVEVADRRGTAGEGAAERGDAAGPEAIAREQEREEAGEGALRARAVRR